MIKDFFKQTAPINEGFGLTELRAKEIVLNVKKVHDDMVNAAVHDGIAFDKRLLIKQVLDSCTSENEEAFALLEVGRKIESLIQKLNYLYGTNYAEQTVFKKSLLQ